ncbi:hypothetical protein [Mongoliibacter ruber]|uniref:Uncharacterized protein n=1 Tax=Mongoliibacter ruber TaxID=1750599 RepID=A0A2T0WHS7_9BACT|nr:hypothetical protein [Mongoliibacter ruber]PRY86259.1 hypothetical protein CLW00_109105 [Mongoliibacter ruber]
MKKTVIVCLVGIMVSLNVSAQDLFEGIGTKGSQNRNIKGAEGFIVPQLSVGFETFIETVKIQQESKLSNVRNNLATVGTNKNYVRKSGAAKVTTILSVDMGPEDFQSLTNDFQKILEEEIENAGFKVTPLGELVKFNSYAPIKERFGNKTEKTKGKTAEVEVGDGKVMFLPEGGIMMYNGDLRSVSMGIGLIKNLKNLMQESNSVILMQNLDIDFSNVELDVDFKSRMRVSTSNVGYYKVTSSDNSTSTDASYNVYPVMKIKNNNMGIVDKSGSMPAAPVSLKEDFVSDIPYEANLYTDKKKSESLFTQLFSLKRKVDVDFDPIIVEMSKEAYMDASRHLFRKYSQEFAKTLAIGAKGGK